MNEQILEGFLSSVRNAPRSVRRLSSSTCSSSRIRKALVCSTKSGTRRSCGTWTTIGFRFQNCPLCSRQTACHGKYSETSPSVTIGPAFGACMIGSLKVESGLAEKLFIFLSKKKKLPAELFQMNITSLPSILLAMEPSDELSAKPLFSDKRRSFGKPQI